MHVEPGLGLWLATGAQPFVVRVGSPNSKGFELGGTKLALGYT